MILCQFFIKHLDRILYVFISFSSLFILMCSTNVLACHGIKFKKEKCDFCEKSGSADQQDEVPALCDPQGHLCPDHCLILQFPHWSLPATFTDGGLVI